MHYFVFQEPGTSDVFDSSIRDTKKSGAMVLGRNPGPGPYRIEMTLHTKQDVRAEVYSAGGRLVRILHDGESNAGSSIVWWDRTDNSGRRLPVGLYFVRVQGEEFEENLRIVAVSR